MILFLLIALGSTQSPADETARPISIGYNLTLGKNRFSANELRGEFPLSSEWSILGSFSNSKENGNQVSKETSLGGAYRPDKKNKVVVRGSGGLLYDFITVRSLSLDYSFRSDWLFSELLTEVGGGVDTTTYHAADVPFSPTENRTTLLLSQEITETMAIGISSSRAYRTEQSLRQFNRVNRNVDPTLYSAGPMEDSSGISIDWSATDADGLGLSLSKTRFTDGGSATSSALSWDHMWTDNWTSSLELAATKEDKVGISNGLITIGVGYIF